MLKICFVFWKSEPQYAYKRYSYKKHILTVVQKFVKLAYPEVTFLKTGFGPFFDFAH